MKITNSHANVLMSVSAPPKDNAISHVTWRPHISVHALKMAEQIHASHKSTQTLQETIHTIVLFISVVSTLSILVYQSTAAGDLSNDTDVDADAESTNRQNSIPDEPLPTTALLLTDSSEKTVQSCLLTGSNMAAGIIQSEEETPFEDKATAVIMPRSVDNKPSFNKAVHYSGQQAEETSLSTLSTNSGYNHITPIIIKINSDIQQLNIYVDHAKKSSVTETWSIQRFGSEPASQLVKINVNKILSAGTSHNTEGQSRFQRYIVPLFSTVNNPSHLETRGKTASAESCQSLITPFGHYGILATSRKIQDKNWQAVSLTRRTAFPPRLEDIRGASFASLDFKNVKSEKTVEAYTRSLSSSLDNRLPSYTEAPQLICASSVDKSVGIVVPSMEKVQREPKDTISNIPSPASLFLDKIKYIDILRQNMIVFISGPADPVMKNKRRVFLNNLYVKISLWLFIVLLSICFFHN